MPLGSPVELIACDAQTGTGVGGSGVFGFAEGLRYANASNKHQHVVKYKVRVQLKDTTSGATATVKVQESNDNSSYTDVYSFPMSIATGSTTNAQAKLFTTQKRYIRVNVTAIAGGSAPAVNSYVMLGTFGV